MDSVYDKYYNIQRLSTIPKTNIKSAKRVQRPNHKNPWHEKVQRNKLSITFKTEHGIHGISQYSHRLKIRKKTFNDECLRFSTYLNSQFIMI